MISLKAATDFAPAWGKSWHHWAYFNCEAMVFYGQADPAAAQRFVAPAVTGFFRSIELGQTTGGWGRGRGGWVLVYGLGLPAAASAGVG